jgi:hypothetical protein
VKVKVTIPRQSLRLSVAGPSKGPDRNRPKAARRAASAGLAAGVFAAQKPPLKVIRLGMLRERHIPGYVKLLLPPRQSRGISQRIRLPPVRSSSVQIQRDAARAAAPPQLAARRSNTTTAASGMNPGASAMLFMPDHRIRRRDAYSVTAFAGAHGY